MTTASLLTSAVESLNHYFEGETALSWGSRDMLTGVAQLHSDLRFIVELLSDADSRNINISAEVNRQVRELACDIEDAAESYARWKSGGGGGGRCLLKYCSSRKSSFMRDLHMLRERTNAFIRERTNGFIIERNNALMVSMGAKESSPRDEHNVPTAADPPPPNRHQFHDSRARVPVGMEDYTNNLIPLLVGEQQHKLVIAICGMGGIGKTTLAKYLYDLDLTVKHFACCAWAIVGMEFQARDILETIFFCLNSTRNKEEIAGMETMELMLLLHKGLFGRRYLLILDDVWSTEAWDTLRFAFPDNENGSRIVITTRLRDVAQYTSISTDYIQQMRPLTEDQSWQLLLAESGLQNDSGMQLEPQIEKIGKQILRYCGGIPLAITVIGRSLNMGMNSPEYWDVMLHRIRGGKHSETKELEKVLTLSYTDLPFHLKPCFLYLGHFPPDQTIPVDKLHLLWMAEGLISKGMEVTEGYVSELANRSLVIEVEKEDLFTTRSSVSCQIHHLIRDLCISIGKKEEFFEVIDFEDVANETGSLRGIYRLAIYLFKFKGTNDVVLNMPEAKRIRSILFFDSTVVQSVPDPTWPREVSDLMEFQSTRVLDFDGVDFRVKKLPRGIEKLIYLSHLSFRGCILQAFPSSFHNFPLLITLDLRVRDSCIMTIPNNVLSKLSSLRHLYFPLTFRSDGKEKLKLDTLKKLLVLENFHAESCDAHDLLQLENLQVLTGTVDGDNLDLKNTINSIKKMRFIRRLSLVVKSFDCYSKERNSIVAELLECNALVALEMEGHLGALPRDIVFGSNLTEIVFNGSEFREDPMPVLGELPNLKSLVLCDDAFVGNEMACELGFPQLKSLKLATLQSLEKWEVEGDSVMPRLTILIIEQCIKLEMLPSELKEITTLKKLMIGSMPEKFQKEVIKMVGQWEDTGNSNPSVEFYDC